MNFDKLNNFMYKVGGRTIDFYDDPSLCSNIPKLLEKVGDVQALDPEQLEKLSDDKFALIIKTGVRTVRKFPICDLGHVKLAAIYLDLNEDKLPDRAYNIAKYHIEKAAHKLTQTPWKNAIECTSNVYNIWSDNKGTYKTSNEKSLPPRKYSLIKKESDGSASYYLPCESPSHIEKSIQYFEKEAMNFDLQDRLEIAKNLKEAAQNSDISIEEDSFLDIYTCSDSNTNMKLSFEKRASICENYEAKTVLWELYDHRDKMSKEALVKILEVWDTDQNFDKYWNKKGFDDPFKTVFGPSPNRLVKKSHDKELNVANKIAQFPGLLEKYMTKTQAEQFRERPGNVFTSLPSPLKSVLSEAVV